MAAGNFDFALAIGGEAGQGIATPGNIMARLFIRRGLHLNAYNAYQSIVRGGHIFLTIRVAQEPVYTHGDKLDMIVCLNQDTMDRHLGLLGDGTRALFNSDTINPGSPAKGVALCPIPVSELTQSRNRLVQNTVAVGATCSLMGLDFAILEESLKARFARQGQSVVDENVGWQKLGTITQPRTLSRSQLRYQKILSPWLNGLGTRLSAWEVQRQASNSTRPTP